MNIRYFSGLIFLLVFLAALFPVSPALGSVPEEDSFTLLVYMTGSDLESSGHAASTDLEEMMAALPAGSNIRLLVQAGGANAWRLDLDPARLTRLEISGGGWTRLEELESASMGDASTLRDFLQWGYSFAPASRYGLILWDHGAGPLMGVCFDEHYSNEQLKMDSLSMDELESALSGSPFRDGPLSFIAFDTCLMCTLEVASLVSPFADYMIASQETEPVTGFDYVFLQGMTSRDPGDVWGQRIVETYQASLENSTAVATLSCLDLRKIEPVLSALDTFFSETADQITAENYPDYTRCRVRARSMGSITTYDFDLIDLVDLTEQYEKQQLADGSQLKDAIREMLVSTFSQHAHRVHGLSIYYPFDNKSQYLSSWGTAYQERHYSEAYLSFIRRISDFYLRDSLFNLSSDYQANLYENAGQITVEIALTPEEKAAVARARLLVLEKVANENYRIVYYDDQQIRDRNTGLSASYSGEALYVVDQEKNILAGPVSYLQVENGVSVYGILMSYQDFHMVPVRLVYQRNEEGQLVLTQVLSAQSGTDGVFLPSAICPGDYDELDLLSIGPQNVQPGATVTSLKMQIYTNDLTVSLDPGDQSWELAILPVWDRFERYAYLRLTDLQGETVCSEVKQIPNANYIPVAKAKALQADGLLSVSLDSGVLVTGYDAGLMFSLDVTNTSPSVTRLDVSQITLGGSVADARQFKAFAFLFAPGETDTVTIFLPLETLHQMDLPTTIDSAEILFILTDEIGEACEWKYSFPLTLDASALQ